jgi:hypothetical protein
VPSVFRYRAPEEVLGVRARRSQRTGRDKQVIRNIGEFPEIEPTHVDTGAQELERRPVLLLVEDARRGSESASRNNMGNLSIISNLRSG